MTRSGCVAQMPARYQNLQENKRTLKSTATAVEQI